MSLLDSLLYLIIGITIIAIVFLIYKRIIDNKYIKSIDAKRVYYLIKDEKGREPLPLALLIISIILTILCFVYLVVAIVVMAGAVFSFFFLLIFIFIPPLYQSFVDDMSDILLIADTLKYFVSIMCITIDIAIIRNLYINSETIKEIKEHENSIKNHKFILGTKKDEKNNRINLKKHTYELFELSNYDIIPVKAFGYTHYLRVTIPKIEDTSYSLTLDDLKLLNVFLNKKSLDNYKDKIIDEIKKINSSFQSHLKIKEIEININAMNDAPNIICRAEINIDNSSNCVEISYRNNELLGVNKKD